MTGESGKSHTGAIYRYYKCSGAKRRLGCHKKAVKKDWIERIAVQYTIQRVFQDELIAQIAVSYTHLDVYKRQVRVLVGTQPYGGFVVHFTNR